MDQSPIQAPDLLPPPQWSPLMISLVGMICIFFFFFSYYRILGRHCFAPGRALLFRNRTQRPLLNEASPEDPSSLQFQSCGLDSSIVYSLPCIQFQKKSDGQTDQGNTDCAVCLGEFKEGEWLRSLPSCDHYFHVSCIDMWFQAHSNCPLCRSHVTHNFMVQHGYSVSRSVSLETLRREDASRERTGGGYQVLFETLQIQRLHRNQEMPIESTQT